MDIWIFGVDVSGTTNNTQSDKEHVENDGRENEGGGVENEGSNEDVDVTGEEEGDGGRRRDV